MKHILLFLIRIYWVVVPKSKRRQCLFKTSCSNYVYNKTKKKGLISGLKALHFRIKNCNPNYELINIDGEIVLISATQNTFNENEISPSILN